MSRRVISRIVNGCYVRVEGTAAEQDVTAMRGPRYGEGSDYFKGARPSQLRELDNHQLYESAERLHLTLSEGRGTPTEISNARDAYDSVIREARGRRASLHD